MSPKDPPPTRLVMRYFCEYVREASEEGESQREARFDELVIDISHLLSLLSVWYIFYTASAPQDFRMNTLVLLFVALLFATKASLSHVNAYFLVKPIPSKRTLIEDCIV